MRNRMTFDITEEILLDTKEDATDALEVALREHGIASSNMDMGVYIFPDLDTRDAALVDRDCILFLHHADYVVGMNRMFSRWYDDYVNWKQDKWRSHDQPGPVRVTYIQHRKHERGCKCGEFHVNRIKRTANRGEYDVQTSKARPDSGESLNRESETLDT